MEYFTKCNKINSIVKSFQDSNKKTLSIVLIMSYQIGSHTPWLDTYVWFCQYNEDEEDGSQLFHRCHVGFDYVSDFLANTMTVTDYCIYGAVSYASCP